LGDRPRDLLFFDLVVRTGLSASHLLDLRVEEVAGLNNAEGVVARESLQTESGAIALDPTTRQSIVRYLSQNRLKPGDYLFPTRKGDTPLGLSTVSRLVKVWFARLNLIKPAGLVTLRKTYHHHFQGYRSPSGEAPPEAASASVLPPLKAKPLQEMVMDELHRAIFSGRIPPGERIMAQEIARNMGVSRTPVREALSRLEAMGFVSAFKGGGFIVSDLSLSDLEEITEIRLLLEVTAARKAALAPSRETIHRLERYYLGMAQTSHKSTIKEYLEWNQRFHHGIYRSIDRSFYYQLIEIVWHRLSPYLYITLNNEEDVDWGRDLNRHRLMLEGIKERNPDKISRWLSEDIKEVDSLVKETVEKYRT